MRIVAILILAACGNSSPDPPPAPPPAKAPVVAAIPAGPAPFALPPLEPAQRRTIEHANGFVTMDANRVIRYGRAVPGPTPYAGEALASDGSLFDEIFPPKDKPAQHHVPRDPATMTSELDSLGVFSQETSVAAVLLVDPTVPARLAMRRLVEKFGNQPTAFAGGNANTATLYDFGGSINSDPSTHADLTIHVDRMGELAGKHPGTVLLEYTDASTTGELVAALGKLGEAGVLRVRVHRMMGWGPIGPSEIVWVNGAGASDDDITAGEHATADVGDVKVDAAVDALGVLTALRSWEPRFRYCFEKRGTKALAGSITLAFDIAADATISHATGKGFDAAIGACMAASLFDLELAPAAVHGAAHASAPISFTRPPPEVVVADAPEKPASGFWCWTHPEGDVGICARQEDQCDASIYGYNQGAAAMGETKALDAKCKPQPTAWTANGDVFSPTKKTCGTGCKQVH